MGQMLNINRVIALVFIAIGIVFLHSAKTFEPGFLDESLMMGPMAYPTWLLYIWIAVSFLYFLGGQPEAKTEDISSSAKALLFNLFLIAGYFFLFPVLGLPLSTFLFLVAFLFFEGIKDAKRLLLFSFSVSFLFWFIFEQILKISMPRGVLNLFS